MMQRKTKITACLKAAGILSPRGAYALPICTGQSLLKATFRGGLFFRGGII